MNLSVCTTAFAICIAAAHAYSPRLARERAYRSKWANSFIQEERDVLIDGLIAGDLIECKSRKFGIEAYHWQVVTLVHEGDVYVHHVTGESEAHMNVEEDFFIDTIRNYEKCRRNNGMDAVWAPHEASEIVQCAICLMGAWKYDLLERNCEHFVNLCRYGKFESMQVNERSFAAKLAARGSMVALSASAVSTASSVRVSNMASATFPSLKTLSTFIRPTQASCLAASIGHFPVEARLSFFANDLHQCH